MGINDRDYVRNDGRSVFDPFTARTQVCIALIVINAIAFMIQLGTRQIHPLLGIEIPGWFTEAFALDIDKIKDGEVWRILTHAFLHSTQDLAHILINMLFLWWFGSMVEDIYGSREFLAFYLVSCLLGGVGFMIAEAVNGTNSRAYGASGAVTAVLLVYACHYPRKTVLLFFFLPVPVWFLVAFNILNDLMGLLGIAHKHQNVAFAAHLSGALFGFLYYRFGWRVTNWLPFGSGGRKPSKRAPSRLRLFEPEEEPTTEDHPEANRPKAQPVPMMAQQGSSPLTAQESLDEHLEAKVDAVLEKLEKHGQESLSDSEKAILVRASEIYRKRRQS